MYIEKTEKPWFKEPYRMYGVECDGCGLQLENHEDFAWYYTRDEVDEAVREMEWRNPAPGVHYCPDEDGDDMEQIPFDRTM